MSAKANKQRYEAWAEKYTARSTKFVACMFLGVGRYDKREADTLKQARVIRARMLEEYGETNYGRGVMIYAITPDNLSVFIE